MKYFSGHNYICRAEELGTFDLRNAVLENGKIVVLDKSRPGKIVSPIIGTKEFDRIVGSWSCLSDPESTCELKVQVGTEEKMSAFFSYGKWGLGKENIYYNQNDEKTGTEMVIDEIIIEKGKKATSFRFEVIIKKKAKLSLVAMTMHIPDYRFDVCSSSLPKSICYDVPKLNQNVVPEIGHEICSPTTVTMLLKHKGFSFTDKDPEFEHRYIASLVADPGHNSPTYGNWVYNTAVIGSFGIDAYVARVYSWEELKYRLVKTGPVGASIRGDTGLYRTGGHLLVVCGYEETETGTYVLCNDPNVNARFGKDKNGKDLFVYCEYPLAVFEKFFRGVIYVAEEITGEKT